MHARTRRALHLLTATGAMTLTLTFAGQSLAQADEHGPDRDRSSSWDGQRGDGDRSRDDAAAPAPAPPPAPAPAPAPEPAPAPAPAPTGTGTQAYKDYAAAQVGGGAQFDCLDALWQAESGWRPTAQNPTSTAYGIAQFLNATWASTGIAKTSDPFQQIDAGLIYIEERYGSPCAAWAFHQANNWY
ncbi:Transglycosylase SLT domain-containing protein [Geodermatophilus africanus]|uniref:Transglycosylase SLT domain-containing protein n=1 Tax=Geodermatophilus africanus TaxID=1137993 RepID=A0A1H3KRQ4_9ACTN|nr:transglycosylase SLT domain-containing protein [Geodermatophilus africanus]SDY54686.1 Transglycosylase SLT domain-containing protein [Geodermatophilus africanus]